MKGKEVIGLLAHDVRETLRAHVKHASETTCTIYHSLILSLQT